MLHLTRHMKADVAMVGSPSPILKKQLYYYCNGGVTPNFSP